MTQSAFIRISSNPKIIPSAVEPRQALGLLEQIVALPHHQFWPDDLPYSDPVVPSKQLVGHRQVTDAYLLGLARLHQGRLVTLDRGVATLLSSGKAALDLLEIISTQ